MFPFCFEQEFHRKTRSLSNLQAGDDDDRIDILAIFIVPETPPAVLVLIPTFKGNILGKWLCTSNVPLLS